MRQPYSLYAELKEMKGKWGMKRTGLVRKMMILAFLLMAGFVEATEFTNPGFESGDFTDWTVNDGSGATWHVNNNPTDNHTPGGNYGAVLPVTDGVDSGIDKYYFIVQDVASGAGVTWDVSVWIRTTSMDENTKAWLEIQFLDWEKNELVRYQSPFIENDQEFTQTTLSEESPENTAYISARGVVVSTDKPANTTYVIFDDFKVE